MNDDRRDNSRDKQVMWNIKLAPICEKLRDASVMEDLFGAESEELRGKGKYIGHAFADELEDGRSCIADVGFINSWRNVMRDMSAGRSLVVLRKTRLVFVEKINTPAFIKKLATAVCDPTVAESIAARLDGNNILLNFWPKGSQ